MTVGGSPMAGVTRRVGGFEENPSGRSFQFDPSIILDDGGGGPVVLGGGRLPG